MSDIKKPTFNGEVLLCEDNLMNQQIIAKQLSNVGLETVIAENGLIGVEEVRGRIESGKMFDLIFMDINMPVMDGYEATEKILALNVKVPIIALTADTAAKEMDYLGKPFSTRELWRCLEKHLKPVDWDDKKPQFEDDLHHKIIVYFVKNNKNRFSEISEALNAGDYKLAHRLAHTLKGNAGEIKKPALQRAAEDIEQQLKSGDNHITDGQLQTLKTELNAVLIELEQLMTKSSTAPAARLDTAAERALLQKLLPLLNEKDPVCLQYIKELRSVTGSEALISYMENFEFEKGITALEALCKNGRFL